MTITAVYAGLLGIVFFVLSVRVIASRRVAKVALGDGGDAALLRRQRVHANFSEYVPLTLLLILMLELQAAPAPVVHLLGGLLLGGRLVHAAGVSREPEKFGLRVMGMGLTFTALLAAALLNTGGLAVLRLITGP